MKWFGQEVLQPHEDFSILVQKVEGDLQIVLVGLRIHSPCGVSVVEVAERMDDPHFPYRIRETQRDVHSVRLHQPDSRMQGTIHQGGMQPEQACFLLEALGQFQDRERLGLISVNALDDLKTPAQFQPRTVQEKIKILTRHYLLRTALSDPGNIQAFRRLDVYVISQPPGTVRHQAVPCGGPYRKLDLVLEGRKRHLDLLRVAFYDKRSLPGEISNDANVRLRRQFSCGSGHLQIGHAWQDLPRPDDVIRKKEFLSGEAGREFLFFERRHIAMNERMQERLRSRAWLTWLLGDTSFRAGEPMTFPRKRIGGCGDTPRNTRPV